MVGQRTIVTMMMMMIYVKRVREMINHLIKSRQQSVNAAVGVTVGPYFIAIDSQILLPSNRHFLRQTKTCTKKVGDR